MSADCVLSAVLVPRYLSGLLNDEYSLKIYHGLLIVSFRNRVVRRRVAISVKDCDAVEYLLL